MRVRRPNVIVVLADDMGYGDFGVFGDGSPRTPVLDGLVAEGVTLTQHYAGSCVCAPSRAALLTGRYAHRTGAVDTLEARGLDRLALREVTLADHFRRAGGVTGLIGKWHLGAIDPRYHPTARGFDEFIGFRGGWSDYYDWQLDWAGAVRRGDGRYLTDVLSDVAVDFIERHRERPFLLHLCFNAPHFPFQAPAEELLPFTASGRHSLGVSTIHAMIARMDRGLGRVLHALDRCGLREDTIVLFTSDNGPQLGGEGEWSTRRHNAGWNGAKGTVYEGGIRVPAVIRWPGGLPAGTRPAGLVHFVDWLPTLAELAGVEIHGGRPLDGRSAVRILRGEPEVAAPARFWQWNRYTPLGASNAAVRDGRWKLLRPAIREAMHLAREDAEMDRAIKAAPETFGDICRDPEPPRAVPAPPPPLLFDLSADPWEQRDLAAELPAQSAHLLATLEDWFAEVEAERRTIAD